jgi:hypothetical protein
VAEQRRTRSDLRGPAERSASAGRLQDAGPQAGPTPPAPTHWRCGRTTPPQVLTITPVSAPLSQALLRSMSARTRGQFHPSRDRHCHAPARHGAGVCHWSPGAHGRPPLKVIHDSIVTPPRLTSRQHLKRDGTATASQQHR